MPNEADLIQPQHQFAFIKTSSTTTALIRTVDSWKLAIDKRERVILVICAFLDLRKTFDVIDHATLLDRAISKWCTRNSSGAASSDLSDRTQFVSCCGCGSSKREITYGVSQGSVLGPTLVNIHINGTTGVCQYCYVALCMLTILKFIRVQRTLIELRNKSIVI